MSKRSMYICRKDIKPFLIPKKTSPAPKLGKSIAALRATTAFKKMSAADQKTAIERLELRQAAIDRLGPEKAPKEGESLAACFLVANLVGCIPLNKVLLEEVESDSTLLRKYNPLIKKHLERKKISTALEAYA